MALIAMIKPRRIVAIGRDAGMALSDIGITVEIVRHPSYGGQAEFISGVNHIYDLAAEDDDRQILELPLTGGQATRGAVA
jgi:hypothetical protein